MVLILHDSNFEVLFAAAADKKAGIKHFFHRFPGARGIEKNREKTNTATKKGSNPWKVFFENILCLP